MADEEVVGMVVVALAVAVSTGLAVHATGKLALARLRRMPVSTTERRACFAALAVFAVGVGCFVYGVTIEARWLSVTHETVTTAKLAAGERVRIVHLTDLHIDRDTSVLREIPGVVNALAPDLVVFTGDALNAAEGLPVFRALMSSLQTKHGRYAAEGNHDVAFWEHLDLFGGGVATKLVGEPVRAGVVDVCGAPDDRPELVVTCLQRSTASLRLVALHKPDLVEALQSEPHAADLYLAGHTHGGQVRVPWYGAVVTLSAFGKRYEMGRYQVGPTTLFVSRGVGFEPPPAPRVRFLCRPEVAVIDVVGSG